MPPKKRRVCRKVGAVAGTEDGTVEDTTANDGNASLPDTEPQRDEVALQGTEDIPRRCETAAKEKRPPLKLRIDQEEAVFDFVEAHQELYSKGHSNFLKTGHKQALWQQLAETLEATDFDGR